MLLYVMVNYIAEFIPRFWPNNLYYLFFIGVGYCLDGPTHKMHTENHRKLFYKTLRLRRNEKKNKNQKLNQLKSNM